MASNEIIKSSSGSKRGLTSLSRWFIMCLVDRGSKILTEERRCPTQRKMQAEQ